MPRRPSALADSRSRRRRGLAPAARARRATAPRRRPRPAPDPEPTRPIPRRPSRLALAAAGGIHIINLPSADTNPAGSLQFNIGHRFSESVQERHALVLLLLLAAQVNLGLSYAPWHGVETGFLRGESLEDYEFFGK